MIDSECIRCESASCLMMDGKMLLHRCSMKGHSSFIALSSALGMT